MTSARANGSSQSGDDVPDEIQSASSKKSKTLKRKSLKFVQEDVSSDSLPEDPQFDDVSHCDINMRPTEDPDIKGQATVREYAVINLAGKKSTLQYVARVERQLDLSKDENKNAGIDIELKITFLKRVSFLNYKFVLTGETNCAYRVQVEMVFPKPSEVCGTS
ncbi:hypothetical protein QYM36_003289 [Artemia franciscana]|uniref:Uncharacterized protein n=1 Tax=Artemia franciscana TaxID=6661 RepID=A0AA88IEX6_ARTSF|nr:hypothetical protein QYM36_003289 [Artemia franciscana]